MTTFADLLTMTMDITKRPELVTMTKTAIRSATLKAHTTDFFHRDGFVGLLVYTMDPSVAWVDIEDIYTTIPQLRGIKFLQCVNPNTNFPTEQLFYRDDDDAYDATGHSRQGIFTLRGSGLRLYPIAQTGKIAIHCYLRPVVTEIGYNSWIANDFPEEVATWAAMIVQHRIGQMDQANSIMKMQVMPFREMLMETYVSPVIS